MMEDAKCCSNGSSLRSFCLSLPDFCQCWKSIVRSTSLYLRSWGQHYGHRTKGEELWGNQVTMTARLNFCHLDSDCYLGCVQCFGKSLLEHELRRAMVALAGLVMLTKLHTRQENRHWRILEGTWWLELEAKHPANQDDLYMQSLHTLLGLLWDKYCG